MSRIYLIIKFWCKNNWGKKKKVFVEGVGKGEVL